MALSGKPTTRHKATSAPTADVGEIFVQRFNLVSIYVLLLLLLAAAIIWSGIKTAEGVQQYHQDYKTLQDMKKQQRKLQVEHQRLLIEQQTFSATPQIASRAVSELNMYSPTLKDKLIIQLGAPVPVSALATPSATPEVVAADNDEVLESSSESTPTATEAGQ